MACPFFMSWPPNVTILEKLVISFHFSKTACNLVSMSSNLLHTKRFVLVKMVDGDQALYHSISCNQNVMKFVTGYALTRRESDEMFRCILEDNEADEVLGRYFIKDRENGEVIGAAKLDQIDQEIEIGYRIIEEHWGKGIATEVTKALIRFAYEALGVRTVIAFVNIENAASIRVLEKAGMLNTALIEDIDEVKYKFTYLHKTGFTMKKVLYVFLGLIGIFLIAGLVMPKTCAVEKEIVIAAPNSEVYEYVESLENQNNWSVWAKLDPNMKHTYSGTDRTVGFTHRWEGNDEVGKGEQEITRIVEGARIETELRFLEPMEATNAAYISTESIAGNKTRVKWGFTGEIPYPMNALMPLMNIEESVGKDFGQGLSNLKQLLEK